MNECPSESTWWPRTRDKKAGSGTDVVRLRPWDGRLLRKSRGLKTLLTLPALEELKLAWHGSICLYLAPRGWKQEN